METFPLSKCYMNYILMQMTIGLDIRMIFFSFCKSFLFITFFLAAAPLFHTVSTRSKKKIYARRGVVIEKFTFCEHYVSYSMTFVETLVHHCHHDYFKQF